MKKVDVEVRVTSIHHCTRDKTRFEAFQNQIEIDRKARGKPNVVYAWFGGSTAIVDRVLTNGFGVPANVLPTDVLGIGVYLSPLRHLSAKLADSDDNGIKHLIFCRVELGNLEKLEGSSQQYEPSRVEFDTGCDDPNNPNWYVVWAADANRRIHPECIVSFSISGDLGTSLLFLPLFLKKNFLVDQPGVGVNYALEELFSKIENSLHPIQVQELCFLYDSFQDDKLSEDDFISRLRKMVGDEVLCSAIRELTG
ncbi:hypothetical protein PTKIN_Ptkin15bG0183300 [Pterospermum kingtungense]